MLRILTKHDVGLAFVEHYIRRFLEEEKLWKAVCVKYPKQIIEWNKKYEILMYHTRRSEDEDALHLSKQ